MSLRDLITAKEALGRGKDLLVAKELRFIEVREQERVKGDSESGPRVAT